jgi:hypothetical protein
LADLATFVKRLGTPIVWGPPGGTILGMAVTKILGINGLAPNTAISGDKADLGANLPEYLLVQASLKSGTAPTAGLAFDFHLAWSVYGGLWPAGVTGVNAFWPADGNEEEWKLQLGPPVVSVISTNDANTVQTQNPVLVPVRASWLVPVAYNLWNQGLHADTVSGLIVWPVNLWATG